MEDRTINQQYDDCIERASKKINKKIQDLENNCREYEMREHLFKKEIEGLR